MASIPKTRLKPLGNRVVAYRDEAAEKTPGGLLLPQQAQEKPKRATVVAVGPGTTATGSGPNHGKLTAPNVSVGDKVLFGAYAGQEVDDGAEKFLLLNVEDIIAVMAE